MLARVKKWEDLEMDCIANIFAKVGMKALIFDVPLVCKSWYRASLDPLCWKTLDFVSVMSWRNADGVPPLHVSGLIQLGVTRSSGLATMVGLPYLTYELKDIMLSISERCPALKSLMLPYVSSFCEENQEFVQTLVHKWKDLRLLYLNCLNLEEILTEICSHCKNFVALITGDYIGSLKSESIKYLAQCGSYEPCERLVLNLSEFEELMLVKGDHGKMARMVYRIKSKEEAYGDTNGFEVIDC